MTRPQRFQGLLLVSCMVFLLLPDGVLAQKKRVDCSGPRGVSGAHEVAEYVQPGEADCDQARAFLDEGKFWRDRASDLKKEASTYKKEAGSLRKDAQKLRDRAAEHRERVEALRHEAFDLNVRKEQIENQPGTALALNDGAYRGSEDSTAVSPMLPSPLDDTLELYDRAHLRYIEMRQQAVEEEIMALEGMIQADEELAADKETTAVDLEQLGINNDRTALEAEAAAALAEEAATFAEESAIRHHVNASLRFIELNIENSKAKRNVRRAVRYIEEHRSLLPADAAREAELLVAEGKAAFDLK